MSGIKGEDVPDRSSGLRGCVIKHEGFNRPRNSGLSLPNENQHESAQKLFNAMNYIAQEKHAGVTHVSLAIGRQKSA